MKKKTKWKYTCDECGKRAYFKCPECGEYWCAEHGEYECPACQPPYTIEIKNTKIKS